MYYGHRFLKLSRGSMNKEKRKFNLKYLAYFLIILMLIFGLGKSWVSLKARLNLIKDARIRLLEEQKKSEDLKRDLAKSESPDYIEQQAREKLNMSKEDELVILMPTPFMPPSPIPTPIDTFANWEKWLRLFI